MPILGFSEWMTQAGYDKEARERMAVIDPERYEECIEAWQQNEDPSLHREGYHGK